MSQPQSILIAGATGGVGRHLVGSLIAQRQAVRALVRDRTLAESLLSPADGVDLVVGDVRQPETLPSAFAGVQAVICTIGAKAPVGDSRPEKVDYEGVRNLVLAARAAQVERFLLISSIAVTHPEHPLNNFGRVLDWKLKGEDFLRTSGLSYTIIRPGGLTDDPGGTSAFQIGQGDTISGGRISRDDVAALSLAALDEVPTYQTTFEVIAEEGDPPEDLRALFASLKTDRKLGEEKN